MKKLFLLICLVLFAQFLSSKLTKVSLTKKTHKKIQTNSTHKNETRHSLSNHLIKNHKTEKTVALFDFLDVSYTGFLEVGGISFLLVFDTGSGYIWVPSSDCSNCQDYLLQNSYDCPNSPSCVLSDDPPETIAYGSGTLVGDWAKDIVSLEGLSAEQDIILATDLIDFTELDYADGIFGLGFEATSGLKPTLINNLKTQGVISERVFSFYFGNYQVESSYVPQFTLDGYDSSLIAEGSAIVYCPVIGAEYWAVKLNSIKMGETFLYSQTSDDSSDIMEAIIDTGTSLICLDETSFEILYEYMIINMECIYMEELLFCDEEDLNSYPDITVNLCGNDLILTPKDYLEKYGDYYVILIQSMSGMGNYMILGNNFMKKYYSIFDMENMQIGFAEAAQL